jgi:hypothetical protein
MRLATSLTALIALALALLAAIYVLFDAWARLRSPFYRRIAALDDAAGPRWRLWVLLLGILTGGSALAARLVLW